MADLTDDQIARLRELCEKATPGPWGWRGNDDGLVELRGHGPFGRFDGRIVSAHTAEPCIVLLPDDDAVLTAWACDDCRAKWAEMEAEDTTDVWEGYRCPKPENLNTVWLRGEVGIEPANRWAVREKPYRSDVASVNHPDAELIAEARNALPALLSENDRLREENTALGVRWQEQFERAEAATAHPCPHVITDDDGTSCCRLAEDATRTADRLYDLVETVRDVAESLGETGSRADSLAAQTLHTACDQAEGKS